MVRKHIPVTCDDRRLVDPAKKFEVRTKVKTYYDLDASAFNFVITLAAKKWKEFKADLKSKNFNETLTNEELLANRDDRVNETGWKWLIGHWRSPEAEACMIRGKENRAKLSMLHTVGSKSYARVGHELAEEQRHPARRDEIFIKTHTHKNGDLVPDAEPIIKELKEAAADHPELKEKSIQDGDLYSHVCGEKEPRGRVRVLGLGPTPQEVGTSGTQRKMPTRLQMEMQACQQADQQVVALTQRLDHMQQQLEQMQQLMLASQGMQNVETTSQPGSNSRHVNIRFDREPADEEQNHGADKYAFVDNMLEEDMVVHRQVVAPRVPPRNIAATTRNREASGNEDESLVGRDVILYAIVRSDIPVAKATIVSTDPSTMVGSIALGREYYEVVVNVVLKRDVILPLVHTLVWKLWLMVT